VKSQDDLFSFDVPKTKSQKTMSIFISAVEKGRTSLGNSSDSSFAKLIRSKPFKADVFLGEAKGRDPAVVLLHACRLMQEQLASVSKKKKIKPTAKKPVGKTNKSEAVWMAHPLSALGGAHDIFSTSSAFSAYNNYSSSTNGTGFAGSSADTAITAAQLATAKEIRVNKEAELAQILRATNQFLTPMLKNAKDGISWRLFGALQSCLTPVLRNILRSLTWTDVVENNSKLFPAILELLSCWTSPSLPRKVISALTLLLLDPVMEQQGTENFEISSKLNDYVVVTLIAAIDDQAQQFFSLKDKHTSDIKKGSQGRMKGISKVSEKSLKDTGDTIHRIRSRLGAMVRLSPQNYLWNSIKEAYCGKKPQSMAGAKELSLHHLKVGTSFSTEETYVRAMSKYSVGTAEISGHHRLHGKQYTPSIHQSLLHFMSSGALGRNPPDTALPPPTIRRLQSELSGLHKSLPMNWATSIFLCLDESRMDLLKVAIVGPDNTPYKNGFFVFDVKIPPTYPQHPPKVLMRTTGRDSVRFNPNLYEDGYVCLSLLGTWSGPGWSPAHSNLLQLFLSIQSLIFVEEPYFNEPGYDNHRNTVWGQKLSGDYDRHIRLLSLKWAILDHLEEPPKGFEDVFKAHLTLKIDEIIQQLEDWEALDYHVAPYCRQIREKLKKKGICPREKMNPARVGRQLSISKLKNNKGTKRAVGTSSSSCPPAKKVKTA